MNLWLLRHGEAESMKTTDSARELTDYGRAEVIETANLLKDKTIGLVLHSPYARAKQTAELICKQIGYTGKIAAASWVTPDDDPKIAIKALAKYSEENILLVSHQPLLGRIASLLTEGNQTGYYPFQTAGLARLEAVAICLAGMDFKNHTA